MRALPRLTAALERLERLSALRRQETVMAETSRLRAVTHVAVALASLVAGVALYQANVAFDGDVLAVELGGPGQTWPPDDAADLRDALWWDFVLVLGYGTSLLLVSDLARRLFWTKAACALARAGSACAATAVAADVVENVALLAALDDQGVADPALVVAAGAAALKFSVLVVAVPVALAALSTTVYRLLGSWLRAEPPEVSTANAAAPAPDAAGSAAAGAEAAGSAAAGFDAPGSGSVRMSSAAQGGSSGPPEIVPSGVVHGRWAAAYQVPGVEDEIRSRTEGEARIGFCVSGGGIRSASVALGALQGLRDRLREARYLASVSGGGYTAGALQLALTGLPSAPDGQPGPSEATAEDVLLQGTPEEDHVRRHSSYLADGAGQWLLALAVVLRGLLASLLLITAAVAAVGVVVGLGYRSVPLVEGVRRLDPADPGSSLAYPEPGVGLTVALAGVAGVAVVAYVSSLLALVGTGTWWQRGRTAARGLLRLLVVLVLVALVVPAVVWLSTAVLTLGEGDVRTRVTAGGSSAVLLSYVAALAAMAWRSRKALGATVGRLRKKGSGGMQALPTGVSQRVTVMVVLVVLVGVFLLVFGSLVGTAAAWDPADGDDPLWLLAGAVVVLALLGGAVDQTWLGLHPFYRSRLASAFAVRRTGERTAKAYEYEERTSLATYGVRREGFPELVFCCAANLSGQEHTPPGRRAVGFTMTSDWIGGPTVGYLATSELEKAVSPHLRRDLTVQAAVAVSGAAFASAMGRQARSFQTLLALTNARLGTWLPNPRFVAGRQEARSWTTPRLPSLRRVTYLLREVFGLYTADERLLYVTDGGHYENLALVEVLRRRCTEIYCIDASGDQPPLAGTLGEALSLAYEELGVRIVLDDARDLVAGSATPLAPTEPLSALNGRLAKTSVVRGKVHYPAESGLGDDAVGTITVAKAVLTGELPYELLAYATSNPVFPHDRTGDQWFDTGQFNSYLELGRQLAERVLQTSTARPPRVEGEVQTADPDGACPPCRRDRPAG